jgi:hypothetical protein
MKFGEKEFPYYWKIIKIPTFVLIAWSVLGLVLGIVSFSLYASIFSPAVGYILMIAVFGFIGWMTIKDYKGTVKIAAWAGALAGAITGFIGAIIGILMIYFVPSLMQYAIMQASQAGADAAAVQSMMETWIYIGLITGPLFSGLIGAGIAAIAALIAKKV